MPMVITVLSIDLSAPSTVFMMSSMSPDMMSSFILTTTSTTEIKPDKHQVPLVDQVISIVVW